MIDTGRCDLPIQAPDRSNTELANCACGARVVFHTVPRQGGPCVSRCLECQRIELERRERLAKERR